MDIYEFAGVRMSCTWSELVGTITTHGVAGLAEPEKQLIDEKVRFLSSID